MVQEKVEKIKEILKKDKLKEDGDAEAPETEQPKEMGPEEFMAHQVHQLGHEGMFRYELLGMLKDIAAAMDENNKQLEKHNATLEKILSKLQKEVDLDED